MKESTRTGSRRGRSGAVAMSAQPVRSERYSLCVYVVTGSTRGIGFGLARELLARGQKVVVNGTLDVVPALRLR